MSTEELEKKLKEMVEIIAMLNKNTQELNERVKKLEIKKSKHSPIA